MAGAITAGRRVTSAKIVPSSSNSRKSTGGELPPGYKGARERAFDKWYAESKNKNKKSTTKPKGSVKSLTRQPESSDSEFTDDEGPEIVACVREKWEEVKSGTPLPALTTTIGER